MIVDAILLMLMGEVEMAVLRIFCSRKFWWILFVPEEKIVAKAGQKVSHCALKFSAPKFRLQTDIFLSAFAARMKT